MSQGTVFDKRVGDSQKSADQNLLFIFSIFVICLHFDTFSKTFFTFMWPCIVTNLFLIKPTDALISQINFCQTTCFAQSLCPSSGVFRCTFCTGICHQTSMTYTIAECTVENSWWWAEELPETCRVSWQKINLGNWCVCWFY